MAYTSFRQFVQALDKAGELKRISIPVETDLLIAEWANREMKSPDGGKALLFENPTIDGKASKFPLAINTMGSRRRMALALQVNSVEDLAQEIQLILKAKPPTDLREGWSLLKQGLHLLHARPRHSKEGACQEVVHRFDDDAPPFSLSDLPILKCWPKDGGRFITLPNVHTRDPDTGARNLGMYRMQVYDERTTGMHWQRQKVAAEHARERMRAAVDGKSAAVDIMARSSGGSVLAEGDRPSGKMEVAVAIGTEPAVTFSAIVPAPPEIEEYLIAGFLRGAPVDLVKCETVDLEVPASSEIVLEGYVNLDELRSEGPFGDHTGFYSLEDIYPVFHLTCVTHRKDPIYATTIVGKPPQEDAYMGKAVERIFLPLMKLTIPELVDINLPIEGVFHNLMIVSIKKSYPGQARKVMNAIWSLGQAMFTKCIVVVDEDVDVQDIGDVTLKVFNHIDPERDIQFTLGPVDSLDHASRLPNYGSKMGIDATRKWASEGFARPWPDEIVMDSKTKALVDSKWRALAKELGIE
jgi:4-hydroxy-3-polyprenylbenzoate decarboxylase